MSEISRGPARWDRDHVACLMDGLRQAGAMTNEQFDPDRATNPLAVFAMDCFEHFVVDSGKDQALRVLSEIGYDSADMEEAVDIVLEHCT